MILHDHARNGHAPRSGVLDRPGRETGERLALSRVDAAYLHLFSAITGLTEYEALGSVLRKKAPGGVRLSPSRLS